VFGGNAVLPIELVRILLITFLYAAAIFGWGGAACRLLRTAELSLADRIAARAVLGCLVFYAVFIAMAAAGHLDRSAIFAVSTAGLILSCLELRGGIVPLQQAFHEIANWRRKEKILIGAVCILGALQIVCGLTPLTFYDSQVYQLLAPIEFLRAGRLVHIPWNVLTNGPMALQLTFGMSWIADPSGNTFKLLLTLFGCLSLLAAAKIGKRMGIQGALTAALFVAAYPEFWIHQTFGVVDLPVAAFLVFGSFWWLECLKRDDWTLAVLTGIAFGFVIASRYQGVVLVPWVLIGAVAAGAGEEPKIIRRSLPKAVAVVAVASAMVLPWLLRNYFIFGNPVFPVLQNILGGSEWSVEQGVRLNQEVMGRPLSALSLHQIALAPLQAVLIFPGNGLFGIPILAGSLAAVFWRGYKPVRVCAILGLGGLVIWGLLRPQPGVQLLRFNAASILFLLSCTGAVLGNDAEGRPRSFALGAVLAFGSLAIATITVPRLVPVWPVLSSSTARLQFWQANVPSWKALEFANTRLDARHDKVLFIGETRALWLRIPFVAPSAYNGAQLVSLFSANGSADTWRKTLHDLGITHILICSSEWQRLADGYGYFRLGDRDLNRFLGWLHSLPLVFDDGSGNVLLSVS
jgi:hypothetical protein